MVIVVYLVVVVTIGVAMTTWSTKYDDVDVLTLVAGTETDRRSQIERKFIYLVRKNLLRL